MRAPRIRFTLRGMIVLVAILAVSLGVGVHGTKMVARRAERLRLARENAAQESFARDVALSYERKAVDQRKTAEGWRSRAREAANPELRRIGEGGAEDSDRRAEHWSGVAERWRERAEFHAGLRKKHEYGASHPWLDVAPDPPDPGGISLY